MFAIDPPPSSAPVACTPNAIPAEERSRWVELGRKVYGAVEAVHELADGYACRLPGDARSLRDVAEYVSRDRLCCAFLRWTIRVEPERGELWLIITGSAAAKQLLRESFETTDMLPPSVARRSGFDVSRRVSSDDESVEQTAVRVNAAAARTPAHLPE